jgi:Glyoxalase/Bleomycin resistance protein/Dioxygenase superfamily
MSPGSMKALQLVVSDARAAHTELSDRGVEVSDLMVITEGDGGTFFGFEDPDGNSWAVQEIRARATTPLIPRGRTGLGEWAGR